MTEPTRVAAAAAASAAAAAAAAAVAAFAAETVVTATFVAVAVAEGLLLLVLGDPTTGFAPALRAPLPTARDAGGAFAGAAPPVARVAAEGAFAGGFAGGAFAGATTPTAREGSAFSDAEEDAAGPLTTAVALAGDAVTAFMGCCRRRAFNG